ncbi:MAG: tetratricopeptide repeat protein [Alistipes sp.]|nr:tetratricopeptide repeat protein [Alistipes sp.]
MRQVARYLAIVVVLLVVGGEVSAQQMKERGWVRRGNRQYEKKNYEKSIERYEKALQYDPASFEAQYDLASALYRQQRYAEAEKRLAAIINSEGRSEIERGEVAYNLGNTQFAQQKYKEALSSYRFAMRCNPNDEDAKFNYALTKRLLQQQQQQNQDKDKQNENKEGQNGQNNQEEKEGDNKNNSEQNEQKPQAPNDKKESKQDGERSESGMTPQQQEAVLQAVQAEEDKTQDKLKEKSGVIVVGGKNW